MNVLYCSGEREVKQVYISKFNSTREKIIDLLLIEGGGKKHYVAIKRLSALIRGLSSRHDGDYYCRNCLYSLRTVDTMELYYDVCKDSRSP